MLLDYLTMSMMRDWPGRQEAQRRTFLANTRERQEALAEAWRLERETATRRQVMREIIAKGGQFIEVAPGVVAIIDPVIEPEPDVDLSTLN